jgi:hypothetical protein
VEEQVNILNISGLKDMLDTVYYTTQGQDKETFGLDKDDAKFVHVENQAGNGQEPHTLSLLYNFCRVHPKSKVLYFHDKGSYHYNDQNTKFRDFLNCFNLSPNCISALDDHDTCGWRATPYPHPHYAGNFWWATCRYVNTLIDPMVLFENASLSGGQSLKCVGGNARYVAEAWIGSAPVIKPADCMPASQDTNFLFGYTHFPLPVYKESCEMIHQNLPGAGHQCATASTFVDGKDFFGALCYMHQLMPQDCKVDLVPLMRKRTQLWYGREPVSYYEWIKGMLNKKQVVDDTFVRFPFEPEVFWVQNQTLHYVPDEALAREHGMMDWGDVIQLLPMSHIVYDFGDTLSHTT